MAGAAVAVQLCSEPATYRAVAVKVKAAEKKPGGRFKTPNERQGGPRWKHKTSTNGVAHIVLEEGSQRRIAEVVTNRNLSRQTFGRRRCVMCRFPSA